MATPQYALDLSPFPFRPSQVGFSGNMFRDHEAKTGRSRSWESAIKDRDRHPPVRDSQLATRTENL